MRKQRRPFRIIKASGEVESFSRKKLEDSLERAGLPLHACKSISDSVCSEVGEGSRTMDIFKSALKHVRNTSPLATVHYSLKRSLFALGPEGHNFEAFVARYFEARGFRTETCKNLKGKHVRHEVDVIASDGTNRFYIECKFHNHAGIKNDVKIALYVKARWDDLKEGPEGKNLTGYYVASNTAFTLDALTYSKGTGLRLLGLNAPEGSSFLEEIKVLRLYPITSLSSLGKGQKRHLLSKGIILAQDLKGKEDLLRSFGFRSSLIDRLGEEITYLQEGLV